MAVEDRTVKIGGRERPVPPVNTRKIVLGTRYWSRLQKHLNDAMLEVVRFADSYKELNKLPITRERAARYGLTDEDFKDRSYVELPLPPTVEQQIAVGFAYVFEKAEDDILRLCALVLGSKQDLRDHRKAGDLDGWLLDQGEELLDEADEPEDLIEVFTEVVRQFKGRKRLEDAVKNLRSEFSSPEIREEPQGDQSGSSIETEAQHQRMEAVVGEAKPGSWTEEERSPSTPSSTSSPASTTGPPTTSSMRSSGTT